MQNIRQIYLCEIHCVLPKEIQTVNHVKIKKTREIRNNTVSKKIARLYYNVVGIMDFQPNDQTFHGKI